MTLNREVCTVVCSIYLNQEVANEAGVSIAECSSLDDYVESSLELKKNVKRNYRNHREIRLGDLVENMNH
jgi:hypothetical protein